MAYIVERGEEQGYDRLENLFLLRMHGLALAEAESARVKGGDCSYSHIAMNATGSRRHLSESYNPNDYLDIDNSAEDV